MSIARRHFSTQPAGAETGGKLEQMSKVSEMQEKIRELRKELVGREEERWEGRGQQVYRKSLFLHRVLVERLEGNWSKCRRFLRWSRRSESLRNSW